MTGIAHRPWMYQAIPILDSAVAFIDLEMEWFRSTLFMPLINLQGMKFKNAEFPNGVHQGKLADRCFDAAMKLCTIHPELVYCEGILNIYSSDGSSMIPMAHGWCCTREGYVVDPTMPQFQSDSRLVYLGLPIQRQYAENWKWATGYAGILDGFSDGTPSPLFTDSVSIWKEVVHGN